MKNLCAEFDLFNVGFDEGFNTGFLDYVNKFGTNIVLDFLTNYGKYQGFFVFPSNYKKKIYFENFITNKNINYD